MEEEEEDKSKYLTKLEKQKVFLPNKTTQYKLVSENSDLIFVVKQLVMDY